LLLYFWADFLVGGWLRFGIPRIRSGLVVVERGWYDIEADPRRYRLDPPAWLLRFLGRALPEPDIALILDGAGATLLERKQELTPAEVDRQLEYWRGAAVGKLATHHLDAERPLEEVAANAREVIVSTLEQQTASRVGMGWANLPSRRACRLYLPRGDRRTAAAGLSVYQPFAARARVGWSAVDLLARSGGFRVLPRGLAPPREVREMVAPYIPARGNIAVARTTHPNRYVAVIIDGDAVPVLLAKLAIDDEGVRHLAEEVTAVDGIGRLLPSPLRAPIVVANESGLIVFEFVPSQKRRDPTALPQEVAFALGQFTGACGTPVHGDFAPWNLLQTADGWVLVDWEAASLDGRVFDDLCHYFVQSHALLGKPSQDEIVDGFSRGSGAIGTAVRAYAEGAGIASGLAVESLRDYLASSAQSLLPADRDRGARARERIHRRLERRLEG
jgi:hypothetical protein